MVDLNKRQLESLLFQLLKPYKHAAKSAAQLVEEIGIERLTRFSKNEAVTDIQLKKQASRRVLRILDQMAEDRPTEMLIRYDLNARAFYRTSSQNYGALLQTLFGLNPVLAMHLPPDAQKNAQQLQAKSTHSAAPTTDWQRKIYVGRSSVYYRAQIAPVIIDTVYQAVDTERFIAFDYLNSKGQTKRIEVFPWGIMLKGENCYLVANPYNSNKPFPVTYAMHRIHQPAITDRSTLMADCMPKDENSFQRFCHERQVDLFAGADAVDTTLQLRFFNGMGRSLYDTKLAKDQHIEELPNDERRLTATVKDCFELHRFILGYGDDVEVEAPLELRSLIAKKLKTAGNRYSIEREI